MSPLEVSEDSQAHLPERIGSHNNFSQGVGQAGVEVYKSLEAYNDLGNAGQWVGNMLKKENHYNFSPRTRRGTGARPVRSPKPWEKGVGKLLVYIPWAGEQGKVKL